MQKRDNVENLKKKKKNGNSGKISGDSERIPPKNHVPILFQSSPPNADEDCQVKCWQPPNVIIPPIIQSLWEFPDSIENNTPNELFGGELTSMARGPLEEFLTHLSNPCPAPPGGGGGGLGPSR